MTFFIVCAILLCTFGPLASAQNIQIQALPQTVIYRETDLVLMCSITNPSQLTAVFFIELLKNSSTTFENVVSVATGQTPPVQWKDSTLQGRASGTGNIDSPSNAQLRLQIDKSSVQCPFDFKMYKCKMSGLSTTSNVVARETSPITILYIVKPTVIEMPRVRILNEFSETPNRQFPVATAIKLTCQGEVGSDPSKTIRWCAKKANEMMFTGLAQTPIHSEASLSGCQYTRSSTITYNLTEEDTFTEFLCESGDTGLCGTGTAIQYINITIETSGTIDTRTVDAQTSILVPVLSGGAVGIVVFIFAIILAIILRRHLHQQQMNRSVYHNHNGRGPIPNNNEDHYTESGPPEGHLYTELNTISRVIGQFAPTSDNQYTELRTTSRQLETDQACPTTDHQYTALNTIQMTKTTNIPR